MKWPQSCWKESSGNIAGKVWKGGEGEGRNKLEGGCDIPEERWWWPGLGQRSGKGQKCRFWRHLRYKVCERGKIDSIPTRAIRGRAKPVGGWGRQSNTWALGSDHLSSDASPDIYSVPQIPAINFFWIAYLVVHLRVFLLLWLVYGGVHMHWCLFLSTLHDPYQPIHLG